MPARSWLAQLVERAGKLGAKQAEIPFDAPRAADHHVIRAGKTHRGNELAGERPEAALHPVANDRAADLFGDGESDPHRAIAVLAIPDQQDEAGRGRAPAAVRGEEVGALLDGG